MLFDIFNFFFQYCTKLFEYKSILLKILVNLEHIFSFLKYSILYKSIVLSLSVLILILRRRTCECHNFVSTTRKAIQYGWDVGNPIPGVWQHCKCHLFFRFQNIHIFRWIDLTISYYFCLIFSSLMNCLAF